MATGNVESGVVDAVVRGVRSSKRYQHVTEESIRRVAQGALEVERGDVAKSVKRTKRGLHEIFGAFLPSPPRYAQLLDRLGAAVEQAGGKPASRESVRGDSDGAEAVREVLESAMSAHASTRERLPILADFYGEIFGRLDGPVRRVRDLACGLNPLAAPWMDLPDEATYLASDIDLRMIEFLDGALDLLGVGHRVEVRDLVVDPDPTPADVTLLLKTVPCIETQLSEHGWGLIDRIDSPVVVVSFPTRSLGRRSKGMYNTYSAGFRRRAERHSWDVEEIEFSNELVYLVRK